MALEKAANTDDHDCSEMTRPSIKRQKVSPGASAKVKKSQKKAGKLSALPSLPLDILLEVRLQLVTFRKSFISGVSADIFPSSTHRCSAALAHHQALSRPAHGKIFEGRLEF
jgi:hypothetical protein